MLELNDVVCDRRTYTDRSHTHTHPWAQLVVPISGALSFKMGSQFIADDQQNVIYVPAAAMHSFHSRNLNRFFVFDIPTSFVPKNTKLSPCHLLDQRWKAIRSLLCDEVGEQRTSSQRLSDLFRYILRLLEQPVTPVSVDYIHKYYNRKITIEQLALLEHYNPSYYCEWFQKQFSLSPMTYIRNLRLENAKNFLQHTDYTLLQIAQQIGYQQQSTVTRLFREHFGISPTQYRLNSRKAVK